MLFSPERINTNAGGQGDLDKFFKWLINAKDFVPYCVL